MKIREFKHKHSRTILVTRPYFSVENRHVDCCIRMEQMDLPFRQDGSLHEKLISINISEQDLVDQHKFFMAAKQPIKAIEKGLKIRFPEYDFWVSRHTSEDVFSDNNSLIDSLQLHAYSKKGELITDNVMTYFIDYLSEILNEANRLIREINATVPMSEISSILLTEKEDVINRINGIGYQQRTSAEFVYEYLNAGKSIRKLVMRMLIGTTEVEIENASTPTCNIENNSLTREIYGKIILESATKNKYIVDGVYFDGKDSDAHSAKIRSSVVISDQIKNDREIKEHIIHTGQMDNIILTLCPVQRYVCITDIPSCFLALKAVRTK